MTALLAIYWPTLLAAMIVAAALAFAGALLATRQASVQTLAVSQGAGLGVSLGLLAALLFFGDGHIEHTVLPLTGGLSVSVLCFIVTEAFARRSHSPALVYLSAFALCWGFTQLTTGFFPIVESHATALYFGDLVTLSRGESFFFAALGTGCLGYFCFSWRAQAERAFLQSILHEPIRLFHPADLGFYLASLLLLCLAVQFLGLLFTLSCLFLPTAIYSFSPALGAGRHLRRITVAAALAAGSGFLLSLLEPRLLTTPTITALLALLPLGHWLVEKLFNKCK